MKTCVAPFLQSMIKINGFILDLFGFRGFLKSKLKSGNSSVCSSWKIQQMPHLAIFFMYSVNIFTGFFVLHSRHDCFPIVNEGAYGIR